MKVQGLSPSCVFVKFLQLCLIRQIILNDIYAAKLRVQYVIPFMEMQNVSLLFCGLGLTSAGNHHNVQ